MLVVKLSVWPSSGEILHGYTQNVSVYKGRWNVFCSILRWLPPFTKKNQNNQLQESRPWSDSIHIIIATFQIFWAHLYQMCVSSSVLISLSCFCVVLCLHSAGFFDMSNCVKVFNFDNFSTQCLKYWVNWLIVFEFISMWVRWALFAVQFFIVSSVRNVIGSNSTYHLYDSSWPKVWKRCSLFGSPLSPTRRVDVISISLQLNWNSWTFFIISRLDLEICQALQHWIWQHLWHLLWTQIQYLFFQTSEF